MGEKFLPCNTPYDQLGLLAEIIKTLRAAFGMPAAVYDESKGGLIVPDDYSIGKKPSPPKAEEPEPEKKAEKAKDK